MILSVVQRERQALITVCVLAGGYIFLVALIMFQVEPESFNSFFDAIYLSVVTLTTVGYGDIYPISQMGKVISMISSFMGYELTQEVYHHAVNEKYRFFSFGDCMLIDHD